MPGPTDLARGWMQKGDSDRDAARSLVKGPGPYDTACFHAQQAAEKYLKAVIALSGRPIPRTHDLEVIHAECVKVEPRFAFDRTRLAVLTPYAVELRYDADFWPTAESAAEAIAITEAVRQAIMAVLPPACLP